MKRSLLPVLAISLLFLAASESVSRETEQRLMEARAARQQEQARQEALIPGELVILFDEDLSPADQDRVLAKHDLVPVRRGLRGDSATVHVTPGSEQRLLRALSDEPAVAAAEQNLLMLPMGHEDPATPNDPFYYAQDWHFSMVQAEEAWHTTRGANVIVGVVDTGVAFEDYTNPQTQDVFKKSPDLSPDTFIWPNDLIQGTNHPNDNFGHGSHVTGTIAAITDNAREGAGIAYEALVVPARVCGMVPDPLDDTPPIRLVYGCPEDLIADGMEWALLQGARVINVSLGGPASGAKQRAAVARAEAAGAIIVAASGNGGNDLIGDALLAYPSALKGVLAVGAVGMDGIRTSYSNYGQGEDGKALDLVAPGGDTDDPVGVVQNSYVQFCEQFRAGTVTDFTRFATCGYRGTSMAAAHASAVAALIFSAYPALTRDQVFDVLRCSARDVGAPGYDPEYGHGIVQAADALRDSDSDGTPDCLDGEIPPPVNTCGPKLTPTPGPAIAARPIARGMPTPVPTPTDTPAPTPESTPSPPVKDTPTPNPGTPTPGPETPTPPAGTSTAEPTPTATRTPTATPTAIATPPPPPTPATPTPLDFACGDVDCDGDVDAVDALWIMRFVVGLQPSAPCLGNGYAYCTAEITIVDALTVLRYVAGLPLNLPPGCPNVGYEL